MVDSSLTLSRTQQIRQRRRKAARQQHVVRVQSPETPREFQQHIVVCVGAKRQSRPRQVGLVDRRRRGARVGKEIRFAATLNAAASRVIATGTAATATTNAMQATTTAAGTANTQAITIDTGAQQRGHGRRSRRGNRPAARGSQTADIVRKERAVVGAAGARMTPHAGVCAREKHQTAYHAWERKEKRRITRGYPRNKNMCKIETR
jgi:hypothetical protein